MQDGLQSAKANRPKDIDADISNDQLNKCLDFCMGIAQELLGGVMKKLKTKMVKPSELKLGMLYVKRGRRRPPGWILVHNRVLHSKNTVQGVNGFRYFWAAPHEGWKVCRCGWRPDWGVHYSAFPNVKVLKRVSRI
jgi:hypothetical protein